MSGRFDMVGNIIAWENGDMDREEEIVFFQYLLDSGAIYHLQGMYQRHLQDLIDAGEVVPKNVGGDPS